MLRTVQQLRMTFTLTLTPEKVVEIKEKQQESHMKHRGIDYKQTIQPSLSVKMFANTMRVDRLVISSESIDLLGRVVATT